MEPPSLIYRGKYPHDYEPRKFLLAKLIMLLAAFFAGKLSIEAVGRIASCIEAQIFYSSIQDPTPNTYFTEIMKQLLLWKQKLIDRGESKQAIEQLEKESIDNILKMAEKFAFSNELNLQTLGVETELATQFDLSLSFTSLDT